MQEIFDYFKAILISDDQRVDVVDTTYLDRGIILNFTPNRLQKVLIESFIRDGAVRTLFSTAEVESKSTCDKIIKQLSHYVASYWFDSPELVMNLEDHGGSVSLVAIRGVTRSELQALVDNILYSNRPAKDTDVLVQLMANHSLSYRLNEVRNNELRIRLFDESKDIFTNGDDAVRYIVFKCTKSTLLIKSDEVIEQVESDAKAVSSRFLEEHQAVLGACFNRHKRIIMALKVGSRSSRIKTLVNQITRISKKAHVPLGLPRSKTFVNDALKGLIDDDRLAGFSLRDKFKYLNLLQFKKTQSRDDVFIIRNGKTWVEGGRPIYDVSLIDEVERRVIESIRAQVFPLKGKVIVLPENIDYGLPTTRKQSVGHLPFGTKVTLEAGQLSSGVYWRNDWGATDLDLSAVDENGHRVGWGALSGYSKGSIAFSGDIVGAPNGAMEFLTSDDVSYGLFVNIYAGQVGCEGELLVGQRSSDKWIERTEVRERFKLGSRGNLIGFVNNREFTVFLGRLGQSRTTFDVNTTVIKKGKSYVWTVKKLLDACDVPWYSESDRSDHDLSYSGFTFDKLDSLFAL